MTIKVEIEPSAIVQGMATILWGSGWADHVEEHGCENISGCEITEIMPEIPGRVYAFAERILGRIEQANDGTNEYALFYMALKTDGLDPHRMHEEQDPVFYELEERFGECLAYMAMGAGVSWFDDHERFPLEVPHCHEGIECMMIADELCEEPGA